jgi:hypothetical protein
MERLLSAQTDANSEVTARKLHVPATARALAICSMASSALSNIYYPNSSRGPGLVFGNFAIGTAERMLSAVMQEFVLRRLTPSAKSKSF